MKFTKTFLFLGGGLTVFTAAEVTCGKGRDQIVCRNGSICIEDRPPNFSNFQLDDGSYHDIHTTNSAFHCECPAEFTGIDCSVPVDTCFSSKHYCLYVMTTCCCDHESCSYLLTLSFLLFYVSLFINAAMEVNVSSTTIGISHIVIVRKHGNSTGMAGLATVRVVGTRFMFCQSSFPNLLILLFESGKMVRTR